MAWLMNVAYLAMIVTYRIQTKIQLSYIDFRRQEQFPRLRCFLWMECEASGSTPRPRKIVKCPAASLRAPEASG